MRGLSLLVIVLIAFLNEAKAQLLFESDEILDIKIRLNVKETITDRKEREEHQGMLYFGEDDSLSVKLKVRGITRAKPAVCSFPPLRLNLKKKEVKETIFAGQDKLKLVTHCGNRKLNEQYVFREYMVYKLYELLTPFSFRVRLCRITYLDERGKYPPEPHYGFLIEDIDDLAARNNMKEFKGKLVNQDACYKEEVDKFIMFQYMIGSLDWSVPFEHNVKLIYGDEYPVPIAVPYDFDFCGMVNTDYAQPPPEIKVKSVRERNFRGFCRPPGVYDAVAQTFHELKAEFYSIYLKAEFLDDNSLTMSVKYLDSFYGILNDQKAFNRQVVRACRIEHKHLYE